MQARTLLSLAFFLLNLGTLSAQELPGKPPLVKLDSALNAVVAAARTAGDAGQAAAGELVPVTIRAADTRSIRALLEARGISIANSATGVLEAYVDAATLVALNDEAAVGRVSLITRPVEAVLSQGVARHNAANWHSSALAGQGVRVGVIDTGFQGFTALMGIELPSAVAARCYIAVGIYSSNVNDCQVDSDHGTAVAEALVDVAPAVQLFIAAPISPLDFHNAVAWMVGQGVRVINYSVAKTWDGPGDGTSPYADSPLRAIDAAVAAGTVFVVAAGNSGENTWFGPFTDTDADNFAEFGGVDFNTVTLAPGQTLNLQMRWAGVWGNTTQDLDLYLYNSNLDIVAQSTSVQNGLPGQEPFEDLRYTTSVGGTFFLVVRRFAGLPPSWVQLQNLGGGTLDVRTEGFAITNPAESANRGMLAVGAASWQTPTTIESFSSRGPTPDGRVKPDIVGVDRADSATYGPSAFSGTSQAAPHVAGLAALVVQGFPHFSPVQVADYLRANAQPRGAVPNNTWGAGLAYLPSIFTLSVQKTGSGTGVVASSPAGISCGAQCSSIFLAGTPVQLSAVASAGSSFVGWTGAGCSGTGLCPLTINANASVTATFAACLYNVNSTSASMPAVGGTGSVSVSAGGGCAWAATSNASWISVSAPGGAGSGSITYTVGPNVHPQSRTGTIVVAGHTVSITQAGSTNLFTRYLAEGSTGSFFDTRIALMNPGSLPAAAALTFQLINGQETVHQTTVPARGRRTIDVKNLPGLADASFSTVVTSTRELVVDRTMSWDGRGYGSHSETALEAPSTTWFLAEGSTSGEFNLFYLLQNANAAPVTATVRYLRPGGQAPIVRSYSLPPRSRTNIYVDQEPGLQSTDVSAVVQATGPIIVERAMYVNKPGEPFAAGHASAGVVAPAMNWFLAEGATGPFFDLFVLIANPNDTPAHVTAEYRLLGGGLLTKSYTVPANGRHTIWVDNEELPVGSGDRPLANAAVSTTIRSSNVPIIAERAMWWPGPEMSTDFWYEAHNSPGATGTGTVWGLAEGEVGGQGAYETYVLIANTSSTSGSARVTLLFEDGTTAQRQYSLPANSRTNVSVGSDFPIAANRRFGVLVESLGSQPAQIVVERAMYSSAAGPVWAAGSNALGTRLQ